LPGRVKCGGTKGEIVVAHGCRKRRKLICGTEGEIVVAHGHLPSPAHLILARESKNKIYKNKNIYSLEFLKNY